MYDIITFGSATWDIFLKPKSFQRMFDRKKFITGKGVCFNLGSKVDVQEIFLSSGGGGTNTAATFANQKLKVAYCGMVGDDILGRQIIKDLGEIGIDVQFINTTKEKPTNQSVVLSGLSKDRIIFVYRGASEVLGKDDIPWKELQSRWFYLAPLSGKLCGLFEHLINFAHQKGIKVAINPGNCQLTLPEPKLRSALAKVDVLILNQEEASMLTKIPYQKEREIFKKIDEICSGVVVMTKGSRGVTVSDGKFIYKAKAPKSKVVDRTGAGDSFGSGFVHGFITEEGNIEYAIRFGMANSTSCLSMWGAKNGLLKRNDPIPKYKVEKEECFENNLCLTKKRIK